MPGRPRKPTALAALEGYRKDRINADEPHPPSEALPPAWLTPDALELWNHHGPEMIRLGVLRSWDSEAFGRWCQAEARAAHANAQVDLTGGPVLEEPVVSRDGRELGTRLVRNQWLSTWLALSAEADKLGAQMGLTPCARAKIRAPKEQGSTPAEAYLTG